MNLLISQLQTERTDLLPEEMRKELRSFFEKYFSKSYPFVTVNSTCERICIDDDHATMLWRTHRFHYVKTSIEPRSMRIELGGFKFYFDASKLQHEKGIGKEGLAYQIRELREDGTIVFAVLYTGDRGTDRIAAELRRRGIEIDEETLKRAFRAFERKCEVDYFIPKDVKKFLREQFDLWFSQRILNESSLTEERIKHLKMLREIAYGIIDLIAQAQDEIFRIWRKPRNALSVNYVITLDRIASKDGGIGVIRRIVERLKEQEEEFRKEIDKWRKIRENHKSYRERIEAAGEIRNQVVEWFLLDIIGENFNPEEILIKNTDGEALNPKHRFLPIDTKYFKVLEPEILNLFNLEQELDGLLVKSENWQALNTLLPRFKGKIQTIYIDPPFNTGSDGPMYRNRFKVSTWITMMEDRLTLAREFLKDSGSIFVRIDHHGNQYVRFLMDEIFGKENFRNEIVVRKANRQGPIRKRFNPAHESIYFYAKSEKTAIIPQYRPRRTEVKWIDMHSPKENRKRNVIYINGEKFVAPKGRHWTFSQEKVNQLMKEGRIRIVEKEYTDVFGNKQHRMPQYLMSPNEVVDSDWTDIPSYSFRWGFPSENSEQLLKRIVQASSNLGDTVMDFFLGSGTTAAVAHKLGRKWIGIEMGDHFYTVILPRMKKVLAYDSSGISRDEDVREHYSRNKAGGFFKYCELEQFEDALMPISVLRAERSDL